MRREGGKGIPRLDHASTGFQIRIKRGYSSFKENNHPWINSYTIIIIIRLLLLLLLLLLSSLLLLLFSIPIHVNHVNLKLSF